MALDDTGYTAPTLLEIIGEVEVEQHAEISTELDVSTTSFLGQINAIFGRQLRRAFEGLEALYLSFDPNSATGVSGRRMAAITGTTPQPATPTTVEAIVELDPGTYPAGSLVARTDNPEHLFTNSEEIVNGGGASAFFPTGFVAETTGPIPAPSGSLVISASYSGWLDISNPSAGTLGANADDDVSLRERRREEVSAQGSTRLDSIRGDILQFVSGVQTCRVVHNTESYTVDDIPSGAIEVIAFGPAAPSADDNLELATQILKSKAAGIQCYGRTTNVDVTDNQGNQHTIGLTRPTEVAGAFLLAAEVSTLSAVNEDSIKEAIELRAAEVLKTGRDLDWSSVVKWALETIPGVLRVTAVSIGLSGGALTPNGKIVANIREKVTLATEDMTLSVSKGEE